MADPMSVAQRLREGRVFAVQRSVGIAVPTTGVELLGRNPNRVAYDISNMDATNFAALADRPISAATSGRRLGAAGGYYSAKFEELGQAVGDPVFAAADTAQVTLTLTEWEVR